VEVVGTLINAAVVAAVGLILAWLGKGRFEAHDRRIDRLEGRLEHRIDGVAHRIEGLEQRLDTLRVSMDAMRSDLTHVALAVGVRRRATNS
jgi:hypothetical protein